MTTKQIFILNEKQQITRLAIKCLHIPHPKQKQNQAISAFDSFKYQSL